MEKTKEIQECCHRTKERGEQEYKDLIHRLNRVEGQIRGIKKMVENDAYCPEILIQVSAVNAALNGDDSLIAENAEAEQNYLSIQQWLENPVAENNQGWGYNRIFGIGGSIGVLNDYEEKNALVINEFYGASTDTMGTKMATLDKMQLETYTKIITGEEDISAFDTFVSQWFSLGGQDITDEVNEWYSVTHSN